MLIQRFCPECGAEIVFVSLKPAKLFRINEEGNIQKNIPNDMDESIFEQDEIEFFCSSDIDHEIGDWINDNDLNDWADNVQKVFFEEGYNLL